jgi:hypothetical protein
MFFVSYDKFVKYFPTIEQNQVIVKPVNNQTLIQRIKEIIIS